MRPRIALPVLLFATGVAHAQDAYTDQFGRTWRQVVGTTGLTWNQVASVCPTDGSPCAGRAGGADLTGWVWASKEEVREMFAEFAPDILLSDSVGGPAYTLSGLGFTNVFTPTWEQYTIVGGFFDVAGWSSTGDGVSGNSPGVSASYNPHNGGFSVSGGAGAGTASAFRGVWLYRAPDPAVCVADTNGDGELTPADFSGWIASFNTGGAACDQNDDGQCTPADFSAWITNFNAGCE